MKYNWNFTKPTRYTQSGIETQPSDLWHTKERLDNDMDEGN